ncbi:CAP domain-containing protein [uncultured Weissella sp.]|uniref:CAP domain-containing protein n=1 Tax=uncultured Weissella sp. TaxID=253243 RepID=UPI00258BF27A|nr:CAP domain-containing protein [uncultured Weissella sp.]
MGDQVKVHKKLYKSGKMWVAAALVAGGALLTVPQSADASVGPMIYANTSWTVGKNTVTLQQDGKADTFQYAGSRMYLNVFDSNTHHFSDSKIVNVTFSNIASRTDSNGHKVYVQRAYVNAGGKKVAVYRGVTKGYNGKLVIINGQMTTKKPDIKKLSALSYKQGQYYTPYALTDQWRLNEKRITVKASVKNATAYNSYTGGTTVKLTAFASRAYGAYSFYGGQTPASYATAAGKYYTPAAKGKWRLEDYYSLTYKTGNDYKYALVPGSKLTMTTTKSYANASIKSAMAYAQSQSADYARMATSNAASVASSVKNGEHPSYYASWASSEASYAKSVTGKNTNYAYASAMAKKYGQNVTSYTKAIASAQAKATSAANLAKATLAKSKKYTTTIKYQYRDGKSAGTDVKKSLYYADKIDYTVPAKAGYFAVLGYNNNFALEKTKPSYYNYTKSDQTMKVIYLPTSADHYKKVNVKLPTTTGIYDRSNWMFSNDQLETWASAGSDGYMWYGESKGDMYLAEQQAEKNFASVMSNAATNSYASYTAAQRSQFKSLASSASNQANKTQSAYSSYVTSSQAAWNSQHGVSASHSSVASSSVASSASVKPSSSSSAVSSSSVASSSVTSSSSVSSSSVANSSAVTSQWLNDLNALRAKERTPLTSDMVSDKGGTGSDEGKPLDALTQDAELTKWAQTRAEELAAQGSISHTDMKNGAPTWAVNSGRVDGGMFSSPAFDFSKQVNGPEALAMWSGGTQNPINMWASELQDGSQGYGHYLTEVSPFANKVGFGYAKTASGATIAVMEIGYHE